MKKLVLESLCLLIYVDWMMRLEGLSALQRTLQNEHMRLKQAHGIPPREELCRAIDLACAFYFKQVLCLQRSAATVLLLRRHGHPAEMVIGAQVLPFKSHAWVESDGVVVNDRPYVGDIYKPLERC